MFLQQVTKTGFPAFSVRTADDEEEEEEKVGAGALQEG